MKPRKHRRPTAWEIMLILLVIVALLVPFIQPISDWGGAPEPKPRVSEKQRRPAPQPADSVTDAPGRGELAYTTHARERFAERKITEAQALMVLQDPQTRTHEKPGEDGGEVYKYERLVDGRKLVIVAEDRGEKFTLITGYWDD